MIRKYPSIPPRAHGRNGTEASLSSRPLPRIYALAALGIFVHNLVALISDNRKLSIGSSAYSAEPGFEGNTRIASLLNESTHDIEGFGIPWFESFRVVQREELRTSEFLLYVGRALVNSLKRPWSTANSVAHISDHGPLTASFAQNARVINDDFLTPACERTSTVKDTD